jgi:hypothetical protein
LFVPCADIFGTSFSLRDVEELLTEHGLKADHTTVWRWVPRYTLELQQGLRRHLKPTNKSWRVDETYVRVKGRWCYLYRSIDSAGAPPSTFSSHRCAMPRRPAVPQGSQRSVASAAPASSTPIRHASTARRSPR